MAFEVFNINGKDDYSFQLVPYMAQQWQQVLALHRNTMASCGYRYSLFVPPVHSLDKHIPTLWGISLLGGSQVSYSRKGIVGAVQQAYHCHS